MSLPIRNGFASRASMFNTSLSSIQQQIAVVEEQAITGIKLIHPSDIPTSIGEAHDLRAGGRFAGPFPDLSEATGPSLRTDCHYGGRSSSRVDRIRSTMGGLD